MNTVIFLTKDNKEQMAECIRLLAERQNAKVNGALIIAHQTVITSKEAQRIARPLIEKFTTTSAVTGSANFSLSHDAQIASLFARFCILAYSRFPGAWLVIDEPWAPLVDNWAQESLKTHGKYGGKASGLAKRDGKTLLTYGPTTLQLPGQAIKMFRFSTNESWRSRGRYLLVGSGFKALEPKDALFRPYGMDHEIMELAKSTEPSAPAEPATVDKMVDKVVADHDALLDQIEKATGKRPHHFTGIDKLRKMAQDLNQPANA